MNSIILTDWRLIHSPLPNNNKYIIIGNYNNIKYILRNYINHTINNEFLIFGSGNKEIRLPYNFHFEPTYVDKELYTWSIHDDYDDEELIDIQYCLKHESYSQIRNKLCGKTIQGYRDHIDDKRKRPLFATTPIVELCIFDSVIHAFTESGSKYILNHKELY